jgi:VWFA-related protein
MNQERRKFIGSLALGLMLGGRVFGQSGRVGEKSTSVTINLIVQAEDTPTDVPQLTAADFALYEAGIQQDLESVTHDPSPALIAMLVDNSAGFVAETDEMEAAARALIRELYKGDKLMIIGYGREPEILCEMTDDAAKLVAGAKLFQKKGRPHLYNALLATIEDALRPATTTTKRVIVLFSDGFDDGSETGYDKALAALQSANIVVYAIQFQDRTYGAPRAKKLGPKPTEALRNIVEGTGGRIFKPDVAVQAMKPITEEIRKRWFEVRYTDKGSVSVLERRLLVSPTDSKIILRTKKSQPGKPL